MVEIRLEGLPDEVDAIVAWMHACFIVLEVSRHFPNRAPSKLVRVYLKVKAEQSPTGTSS
jgi:hypothetical protein